MTRFGKYRLVSELGRGGMGEVFLAREPVGEGLVVIKRVLPDLSTDDEVLHSFLDETRIAARLRHPHIVRIDELGQVDGDWYVRMEYVPGVSLAQLVRAAVKAGRPLPLDTCLAVGAAVGAALAHAHAARDDEGRPLHVVHRDVTPQNVLVGRGGEVKLIDFGVAVAEQRYQASRPNVVKGKMAYMAPEQAEGKPVDRRTDLFALGVCLWEMLTGLQLFYGDSPGELYVRVQLCEVPLPSHHRAQVPPEVDALVLRALARDPDARFQRAEDLVEAIETVAAQYQLEQGPGHVARVVTDLFPEARAPAPASDGSEEATAVLSPPGSAHTRIERPRPPLAEVALTPAVRSSQRPRGFSAEEAEIIGRAGELADLHQLLGAGAQLVSLLGPGGVGKSCLARAVALQQAASFGDQVFLADATAARDVEGFCLAVADALGTPLPQGDPVEGISAILAGRRRCLLVVDHFEHLETAPFAPLSAWLAAAKGTTLLLVSRVTLELEGEVPYVVGPLRLEAAAGTDSDAAQLFLARVVAANPARPAASWDRTLVRELVRRLEGMPLAIELAAAQVAEAPDTALPGLLRDDDGAGLSRVDDAFETSWRQLTRDEQAALVRCATFECGFTAEAAMALLRPQAAADPGVALQLLHRLRRRSLVRVSYATSSEHPRFQLYESIRGRVLGRLPALESEARGRHADFYLHLGERLGDGAERGSAVLDALAAERENLVAAWRYWMGQGHEGARRALRVLLALDAFFVVRGPYGAQLSMLDATLARLGTPADRAPGLEARARVLLSRGRLDAAAADLEALLAAPADDAMRARAIAYLGVLRGRQGHPGEAQLLFERAQGELRRAGDLRMEGRVFSHLAALEMDRSHFDASARLYERALDLHVRAGDKRFEAITLSNLAALQQMRGAWDEAEASLDRSIALHRALGNRRSEGIALANLGDVERDRGAGARAIAHYQRALKVNQEVGNRRFEAICMLNHALLLLERRDGTGAGALLDEALSLSMALRDTRHAGLALGARAALRAFRGEPGAGEDLAQALSTLEDPAFEPFRAAVELYAAQLDLARGATLEASGRAAEARAARDAAAARVAAAVAPGPSGSRAARFEHVRMALRVLKALGEAAR